MRRRLPLCQRGFRLLERGAKHIDLLPRHTDPPIVACQRRGFFAYIRLPLLRICTVAAPIRARPAYRSSCCREKINAA